MNLSIYSLSKVEIYRRKSIPEICVSPIVHNTAPYSSGELESHLNSTEFLISIEQGDDVFDWSVGLNVVCGTENIATIAS